MNKIIKQILLIAASFVGSWAVLQFGPLLFDKFSNYIPSRVYGAYPDILYIVSAVVFFILMIYSVVPGLRIIKTSEGRARMGSIVTTTIGGCLVLCGVVSFFLI